MNTYTSQYIAIYCRVSTDDQVKEGVSLEEQQERLQAYCKAMNWSEDVVLYIEDGFSGKNIDRPHLKKLIEDVKAKEIKRILVTKLDRMSRKLLDLLTLIDLFQEHDVSFVSISESFDTNTPSGRLTLQVLGAVSEFERERIRERVFENMHHAASKGKWLTQHPYGYRLENKELVIHEDEAKVVRDIFSWYTQEGHGFYAIAKKLNMLGIPSRQNKQWSIRSIKLLLSNPVYKGTLVWNRKDRSKKKEQLKQKEEWIIKENVVPSIVTEDVWHTAEKRMQQTSLSPRSQTSPHLLGGLLKCGKCGSGMSIGWSGSKNNRYRVYRCSANKNKGTCTSKQYRSEKLEELFKDGLSNLCESFRFSIHPSLSIQDQKNSVTNQMKVATAKKRYQRKVEAYASGLIELEDLQEEKRRLDTLNLALQPPSESNSNVNLSQIEEWIKNKLKNVHDALNVVPVEELKPLIQTIIEKVILNGEEELEIILHPII
ncbi:recombinase family protein [Bacillus paranthracis]|uniref:recombinase family protein n=1 Tax=Bacillus paranthracis TaxID=2026186 RepID=UPI0013D085B6|nr:recombinase family protein [Bacillus paranthracis]MDK7446691.1 recombinase family protein [Bacillus paranthracis]MDN8630712.1 recombinase family protein [Bacillus paranthracis]MDN8637850.1 recombinase family protein [Bacillus paranthracis]HDR7854653.1 recombinase family protein [Bacillus paranthracis]